MRDAVEGLTSLVVLPCSIQSSLHTIPSPMVQTASSVVETFFLNLLCSVGFWWCYSRTGYSQRRLLQG